ncbi:MAG TPA: PKD domain-containing protein [Candidatus Bathyarchaeia archaeon]|nr:PKD domain-containing protein [Candidatus Bathyarchaeia archaeon]
MRLSIALISPFLFLLLITNVLGASSVSFQNTSRVSPPAPLAASASANPMTAIVGQQVSFSCMATGGIQPYSYSWTFGDGGTGTGPNPTHAYTSVGTKVATCTVMDLVGSSAMGSTTVIVV